MRGQPVLPSGDTLWHLLILHKVAFAPRLAISPAHRSTGCRVQNSRAGPDLGNLLLHARVRSTAFPSGDRPTPS